jgi:predicted unusual protein kinase regulating ubiquinone biosynthesis (AarF/ABC1/UbiB family)
MAPPEKPALPPALRSLLEAGGALVRRSSSGRVGLGRAAALVREDVLPRALRRLPAELEAARAEASVPVNAKDVEKLLKAAWGAAPGKVLDAFDPEPLAVTPSAQVHRGERDGRAVAIKVLRPGLASAVRNDLALLDVLAAPLRQVFGAMDAGAILREVRETALDELDLEHEASTQRQVKRLLRGVAGVTVPAPDLELSGETVLVTELLDGTTLAAGARPADPGAAARALVAAHVAAARGGLILTDPRPGHVVVLDGGSGLGLLGTGLARPVDRDRVSTALVSLVAWRAGDQDGFAAALADGGLGLLPTADAIKAYAFSAVVLGDVLTTETRLDGPALAAIGERALAHLAAGLTIAGALSPHPHDLAVARSIAQLASVLALLGASEDWGALMLDAAA